MKCRLNQHALMIAMLTLLAGPQVLLADNLGLGLPTLLGTSITTALTSAGYVYLLAIVISFGVAMLIKLLGKALKQFKGEP